MHNVVSKCIFDCNSIFMDIFDFKPQEICSCSHLRQDLAKTAIFSVMQFIFSVSMLLNMNITKTCPYDIQ